GTGSPIQALCDAGLPQEVCDALGGLIPGASAGSPILAQSDAGIPQEVCDALGGDFDPSQLDPSVLEALLKSVLDLLGLGGTGSPFQPLCDAVPELQPLCDATSGGLALP
ncbi:hypothetical protein, partial [Nocardioides sp.]|uniref:hypothetical protein n=1 Tax=Nocardioides sp. TaxID=35761 RepID=UPI0027337BCA